MPINEFTAGLLYERLIKKASCASPGDNEAKALYFQNLYKAERGDSNNLIAGSYKEQFEDIRTKLIEAVQQLQKKGLDSTEFVNIEERINTCSTANCLAKQVKYAMMILTSRG